MTPKDRLPLQVTVDELPDFKLAANARRNQHWSEQAKATALERERWMWLLKPWGPETPYKQPVRITFGFRFGDNRKRDIDGFSAACKPLLDAMTDLAWLYGDDTKWVKSVTYEVLDDGEPRTVVTVTKEE